MINHFIALAQDTVDEDYSNVHNFISTKPFIKLFKNAYYILEEPRRYAYIQNVFAGY